MNTVTPLVPRPSAEDAFQRLRHELALRPLADTTRVAALALVMSERQIMAQYAISTTVVDREVQDVDEPMRGDPGSPAALQVWERSWPPADTPQSKKIDARDCFQAIACVACGRSGSVRCARCVGSGTVPHHKRPNATETCADCHGHGTIPCRQCSGAGTILRFKRIIQSAHTKVINEKYPEEHQHIPHGPKSGQLKLEQPLGFSSEAETLARIVGSIRTPTEESLPNAIDSELNADMFRWLAQRVYECQLKRPTSATRLGWTSIDGHWFQGWRLVCQDGAERHAYFVPDTSAPVTGPPIRNRRKVRQLSAALAIGLVALVGVVTWHQRQEAARQLAERQQLAIEATATAAKNKLNQEATAIAAIAQATQQEEEAQLLRKQAAKQTMTAIEGSREQFAIRVATVEGATKTGDIEYASIVLNNLKSDLAPALEQESPLAGEDWMKDLMARMDRQGEVISTALREAEAVRKATAGAEEAVRQATAGAAQALMARCGSEPPVSPWSNMAGAAKRWLGDNLNDPGSLEVIGCTPVVFDETLCWVQSCRIRAKNAFGAYIVQSWGFSIARGRDGDVVIGTPH